jgi:hypothetical protein
MNNPDWISCVVRRLCVLPLLACAASAALAAPLPEAVSKLAGSSDEVARSTMAQNGYVPRGEKVSWGRELRFWWNGRTRQCVQLTVWGGRVISVYAKGESDCAATGGGGTAGGGVIDPAQLVGLPRQAAEARLAAAGFSAMSVDESKVDAIYVTWYNGRQCLSGAIVADRIQQLTAAPLNICGR